MDGVTLLDRAAAAGLRVVVVGDDMIIRGPRSCVDLVAQIREHKEEVAAELAARAEANPSAWETLATQRWGGADASPGIDIPATGWRWEVANWPIDRWLAWHRRVGELITPGADATAIREAQRRAYHEAVAAERPTAGVDDAPTGFEPIDEADAPAWAFDESLTIRTADVRASIEHHRAQLRAEERSRPAARDRLAPAAEQGRFPRPGDDRIGPPQPTDNPNDIHLEAI